MVKVQSRNALHESTQTTEGMRRRSPLKAPDMFAIGNRDPGRAYRFISRTMLEKNGGFDRRGWIPITEANSKGETLESPTGSMKALTTLPVGDTVLAFQPIEIIQQRRADLAARNDTRDRMVALKSQAINAGVEMTGGMEVQSQGKTETY